MKMKTVLIAAALAWSAATVAQPSMYYLWKNSSSGETVCEPESPGKGWVKASEQTYSDIECKVPL
ncbi:Uncharacterised protein [Bordetella ansorpii]|uniref:Secreted protein n=1 Tax=Bordetella ansorpii TaxID=288768 RepID=A0A157S7L5_9BORD|nr:hypothetical protein [Bordetella ansorpii]SAI65896.1 Uncharacterised protein [Bordetella ansorpii]